MDREFCAFLRGVNVNGTNMKMNVVTSVFQDAGMKNATAVLASGNIVFSSDKSEAQLRSLLEKAMSEYFSYEAFLFVKSKEDIDEMLKNNPFLRDDEFHIYCFICENDFEHLLIEEFDKSLKLEGEEAQVNNGFFYWKIKKGMSLDGSFSKILGKKQFKDKFTSRNLNTIEKIMKKF